MSSNDFLDETVGGNSELKENHNMLKPSQLSIKIKILPSQLVV